MSADLSTQNMNGHAFRLADALHCFLVHARHPQPHIVLDYVLNVTKIDCAKAWRALAGSFDHCLPQNTRYTFGAGIIANPFRPAKPQPGTEHRGPGQRLPALWVAANQGRPYNSQR